MSMILRKYGLTPDERNLF
ncbi:hypothetical protein [Sicyoidochytrium minutum DNA virus]|nr:hypothetical protein [Sicyoidochytrium minutum DNA virus]